VRLRTSSPFTAVRTEGAILPPDLLQRIVEGDKNLRGLSPDSYHLATGERINEAINRSWNRLQGAWTGFKDAREKLTAGDPGTGMTRDRWLMVLFQELDFGRLVTAKGLEVDGKSYPISHIWQNAPMHLVGCGVDLDRRAAGVAGAARSSPHSLVQEFLNRTEDHLWGFVSNGLRLRVLRDNASLVRQAFVEFDLESMMEGEVYSDFVLLWLLCHQSRVEVPAEGSPDDCWLEKWSMSASEQGTRALEGLRVGVESAIAALGRGLLAHPSNGALRDHLRSGDHSPQEYYRQLLRVCYRLIFLFVAEDRELLLDPTGDATAKSRYMNFFSTRRLRQIAGSRLGTKHSDLFQGLTLIMQGLGSEEGIPSLALSPFGSYLWSEDAIANIKDCSISNRDLLDAIRALAYGVEGGQQRPVDYTNLGAEELGSIYESLLELHPEIDTDAGQFMLTTAGGHERRTTGSYYTPTSLISELLDSALDPVISDARSKEDPEQALLALKIVDPATGSGHFLIAAAHRIAKALASTRTGEDEPSPDAARAALRDVIGRCIYGVDVNEMAVELCKVSLWMETLEPGKPLSFLDHRIRCGNSLLGSTPALIDEGLPEDAFKPIEGDDKEIAARLRASNKKERAGQGLLEMASDSDDLEMLAKRLGMVNALGDTSIIEVRQKEQRYAELIASPESMRARMIADGWCAGFVGRKAKNVPAVTEGVLWQMRHAPESVDSGLRAEVQQLATDYRFFHWHLEFPDVFQLPENGEPPENRVSGWSGGFDLVLGNPPWERVKLQEKEWFARYMPEIASAPTGAARRRMISDLAEEDPHLNAAYRSALRESEAVSHFLHNSGRYPLCGRGDVNTYAVFAELMKSLQTSTGRVGCILPTGIATDHTTQHFFGEIVRTQSLVSLFGFENEEFVFPAIHHATRFCLLTLTGPARPSKKIDFVFFARRTEQLHDSDRRFTLSPEDIGLLNPNTLTCPVFRYARDAEIQKDIYAHIPVFRLSEPAPDGDRWDVSFMTMFHMTNDSSFFRTRDQLESDGWNAIGNLYQKDGNRYLPLYEAKMIHHFDHRFGTYKNQTQAQANQGKLPEFTTTQHADPDLLPVPRYWVSETSVETKFGDRWKQPWLLGWRDITGATVKRTVIATILPRVAVGNKIPLVLSPPGTERQLSLLCANLSSYILDYTARSKVGGTTLNFFIMEQLPVLAPETYGRATPWDPSASLESWVGMRVLELAYTSWDLEGFAQEMGWSGSPFAWSEGRRMIIRAELDAAYFHLYGVVKDDVDYIMETFRIVREDEEKNLGEYRSKRLILEAYDAMDRAIKAGKVYSSPLEPPVADPLLAVHEGQPSRA
jgi:hypothetical protein